MNLPFFNMQVSAFLKGPASGFGRHVLTFAMGLVAAAVGFGVINAQQGAELKTAVGSLGDSLQALVSALTTFMGALAALAASLSGLYAAWKAMPKQQAAALVAAVPETRVITSPDLAASIPSNKVLGNDTVEIVTK